MKNLILTIALGLAGTTLASQPVFENTYTASANICHLESLGEVYYTMDVVNRQCLIFSMDHSLLKTIPLPTPDGYYLADIQFMSDHLFNSDNLIELVYIYSMYVPTELSYYYTFETRLINENGAVLLSHPGAGFTNIIETGDHGKKFLVYEYNYSVIPYLTSTHVYSLPDQTTKSESLSLTGFYPGDAYPNPASRQVNLPVFLPEGIHSGTVELFDANGQKMLSYPVSGSSPYVEVPTHHLVPGTYLYQFHSGQWSSEARKFMIRD